MEINGYRLFLPVHDVGVADILRLEHAWEPEMTREFENVIKPGMTILDIGANIGYYTILASRLVGMNGRVLSFEPDPNNIALLKKNIEVNSCTNVEIFPFAVGIKDGSVELNCCGPNAAAHSTAYVPDRTRATIPVRMICLDDFLKPELYPDVVKMDIEGGEAGALDGMGRLLENPRLRAVFIEVDTDLLAKMGSSTDELLGRLRGRGFQDRRLDPVNVFCVR